MSRPSPLVKKPLALRQFRALALIGGVAAGLLVGILLSGPHFYEWPAVQSLSVVLLSGIGGALIGWFCPAIAAGSVAGGGAVGAVDADCGDFSEPSGNHGEGQGGDAV